jgi:transposase-like protein
MAKTDILNEVKNILSQETDFLKPLLTKMMQEVLEQEMNNTLGVDLYQRSASRMGYRAGYYPRQFITRIGTIELRVPRDREGKFSTELFERYQRSEKALLGSLAEMYVQGVSTRKVKAITEELCGHEFSAATISNINKTLDSQLEAFALRPLDQPYPYVIFDARYEKVREGGIVTSQAVLIALGINWDGRKEVIGVDVANRESQTSWKEFLIALRKRGLHGVEFIVSDDHQGLKKAIREIFPESIWQRCYVHFLRNALDYLPRKGDGDCLQELRWIYERRNLLEAQQDLRIWLKKWEVKYPKLCCWVEENIEQTLSFYRLPLQHHKHMKSTNLLERMNQEIKRRTRVVRIFPSSDSCNRLIRSLVVEAHENWIEESRYLNMNLLQEQKRNKTMSTQEVA